MDKKNKARQKQDFDSRRGARELSPLRPGDSVWVPDRGAEAEVREEVAPRSYEVESEDGSFRRNRQDIVRLPSGANERHGLEKETEASKYKFTVLDIPATDPTAPPPENLRRSSRNTKPPDRLDPSC